MTHTAFTTFLLSACVAAAVSAEVPAKFEAQIDHFEHDRYAVELRDASLSYRHTRGGEVVAEAKITPTAAQWREFRKALDGVDVWAWQRSYQPEETVFDGTTWSLSVRYADRSVFTSGENCYPEADARPCVAGLRTPRFMRLESALETLLGGKSFRSADHAATKEP